MQPPDRFPTSEDELAEWSVYADWLLTRGDPRGELLARELAVPAVASKETLELFHAVARRRLHFHTATPMGWCLGHARTFEVPPTEPPYKGPPAGPTAGAFGAASGWLGSERATLLEAASIAYESGADTRHWRRVLRAIPRGCAAVTLVFVTGPTEADLDHALEDLPATVRELRVLGRFQAGLAPAAALARIVDDRFAEVALGPVSFGVPVPCTLDDQAATVLRPALERTRSVRLRAPALEGDAWHTRRVVLDGEASFVHGGRRRAIALPSWSLLERQRRFGVVPVRAQLARSVPEGHAVTALPDGWLLTRRGLDLVRRGPAWTVGTARADEPSRFTVDGRRLAPGELARLHHGAAITVDDDAGWVFWLGELTGAELAGG